MAVRKAIISILIILTAAPAFGLTKAEWELQFVEGLAQAGYTDLAAERGKLVQQEVKGAQAAQVLLALARSYVGAIPSQQDNPEQQQALIDKAQGALDEALKLDPKLSEDVEYLAEVALVHQQIASSVARQLADLDGAERKALGDKVDKLFTGVVDEFKGIKELAEKHRKDLYNQQAATEEEQEKLDRAMDESFITVAVMELRQALANYAWLESYENRPNEVEKKKLAETIRKVLEDVEWQGAGTSLVSYAAYYRAMVSKKLDDYEKAIEEFQAALKLDEKLLVPEILGRIYLDYADTLIKAKEFSKAVTVLKEFSQHKLAYRRDDNAPRALLYKATALFELAMQIERAVPNNGGRADEARKVALECCQMVMKDYSPWSGTATALISKYADADTNDPIVLMQRGRDAYVAERYAEAANYFRKIVSITKYADEKRASAGWFLVMAYYKQNLYYETAAASEMVMTLFDPNKFPKSQQTFNIAIAALQKQWDKSKDDWDRELYMSFREKLGEQRFIIFVAQQLIEQEKYDDAVDKLKSIPKTSDVYPMAMFMLAECASEQGRALLKDKDVAGFDKLAEAVKLYKEFLSWSENNPPDDASLISRRDLESRAIVKLGQLLTLKVADSYYMKVIKAGKIADALNNAAAVMGQTPPEPMPTTKQAAAEALKVMIRARYQYVLELMKDFAVKYPQAKIVQPYAYHLAVVAATALKEPQAAEEALNKLAEYEEFRQYLPSSYYAVGGSFDAKARALEEDGDQNAAEKAYTNALNYYLKWADTSSDANSNFDVLYYITVLLDVHGQGIDYDRKYQFVKKFLEADFPTADPRKIDRVRLAYAKLLTEKDSKSGDALVIYTNLYEKYNKQYEEEKAENPNATRSGVLWDSWQSMARIKKEKAKTPEEYKDAALEFNTIKNQVPRNTDTWWGATYDLADCLVQMERYDDAVDLLDQIQKQFPSMGGPQLHEKFRILLMSVDVSKLSEKTKDKMTNLIDAMRKDEESQ